MSKNKLSFIIFIATGIIPFYIEAVCGVVVTAGLPANTRQEVTDSWWTIPPDIDLSVPGLVYVLNAGAVGPVFSSVNNNQLPYYLTGWKNILSHDGPFTMSVKQTAWDEINNYSHESARLEPIVKMTEYGYESVGLGNNVPEIKVPIDSRFSGKKIGYGYIVDTTMTAGRYFGIEDGMCHPSVPVGTSYTFQVYLSDRNQGGHPPPQIRDADGNILWTAPWGTYSAGIAVGTVNYTEIADVSVEISPASLAFGQVLFDEVKSLPVTITTKSNVLNTKINLEYEFTDDVGEANLKINATGIDGLSDTITSPGVKNSPVTLMRNISITNKNTTAGPYSGYLRVTSMIP
ncbi:MULTISPECIES: hypothetical protein [unclassified Citrobacter]|uniref:hypothetical protein n=1 Tax=unclassified Citrobacter TaxID=2644389 RepID=UPI001B368ECB|nr:MULTISPECIES: hypothetical protein [unclassified Citrobacter]MBP8541713.1 hypothetical protein [Citrobacter sp. On2M]MBW5274524.1 hypothetical protein [Citrobacter sp. On28M]